MLLNRRYRWFLALLSTWFSAHGPRLKLGQPHPEQQMLVPSLVPTIHEASLPNWMTVHSGMGDGVIIGPSE